MHVTIKSNHIFINKLQIHEVVDMLISIMRSGLFAMHNYVKVLFYKWKISKSYFSITFIFLKLKKEGNEYNLFMRLIVPLTRNKITYEHEFITNTLLFHSSQRGNFTLRIQVNLPLIFTRWLYWTLQDATIFQYSIQIKLKCWFRLN